MSDALKAEIKKLEDRRFQAMIDGDFDALEPLHQCVDQGREGLADGGVAATPIPAPAA